MFVWKRYLEDFAGKKEDKFFEREVFLEAFGCGEETVQGGNKCQDEGLLTQLPVLRDHSCMVAPAEPLPYTQCKQ